MKMNKREEQKNKTRDRILDTAYQIMSDKGFSIPTNEISQTLGVSHGTIFAHFSTRDELVIQVVEKFGVLVTERLRELVGREEGLRGVLEAHLEGLIEQERFYCRLIWERHSLPCEAQQVLVGIQSAISHRLGQVLEKEQNENQAKKIPSSFIFNTWIGLIHYHLQNQELFSSEASVIHQYKKEWIDYFIKLIQK